MSAATTRPAPRLTRRRDGTAVIAFGVVLVGALAYYLWLGRHEWFAAHEWDFLALRSVSHPSSLLRPHNEHWSTVPILVYRSLYAVFGLRWYLPYLLVVVVTHLVVAGLLWVLMRRAEVRTWIATVVASVLVLFGTGYENILWAFQIGFVGALAFGLGQLLLADHDGGRDRRDWWALAAGLIALMCSAVGVTMVVVVGIAVLIRRGWRAALFQTLPLAGAYALLWWATYGRSGYTRGAPLRRIPGFMVNVLATSFRSIGQNPVVGVVLAVGLVVGLVLAWAPLDREQWGRRAAAPAALLMGAVVFVGVTGVGRAGPETGLLRQASAASRYQYVVVALVLPALGVAVEAIGDRLGRWWPALLVVFLIGIPGNLRAARDFTSSDVAAYRSTDRPLIDAGYAPISARLPADLELTPLFGPGVPLGWWRQAARDGRLPPAGSAAAMAQVGTTLALAALQPAPASPTIAPGDCRPVRSTSTVHLAGGDELRVAGGAKATVALVVDGVPASTPRPIGGGYVGQVLEARIPVEVAVVPSSPTGVTVCHR